MKAGATNSVYAISPLSVIITLAYSVLSITDFTVKANLASCARNVMFSFSVSQCDEPVLSNK